MKRSSPKDFIKVWYESESYKDVSEKLGITLGTVQSRGSYFRKHGIKLKKFKRGGYNWSELKEYADSLK